MTTAIPGSPRSPERAGRIEPTSERRDMAKLGKTAS
jgi:hypothetical protein